MGAQIPTAWRTTLEAIFPIVFLTLTVLLVHLAHAGDRGRARRTSFGAVRAGAANWLERAARRHPGQSRGPRSRVSSTPFVDVSALDLLAVLVTAAAVYLPKAVPLVLVGDRLSRGVRRWLEYVAPAVLAALVAPSVLVADRTIMPLRWELLAFVATFVVALLTRRMLPSLVAGVVVLIAIFRRCTANPPSLRWPLPPCRA